MNKRLFLQLLAALPLLGAISLKASQPAFISVYNASQSGKPMYVYTNGQYTQAVSPNNAYSFSTSSTGRFTIYSQGSNGYPNPSGAGVYIQYAPTGSTYMIMTSTVQNNQTTNSSFGAQPLTGNIAIGDVTTTQTSSGSLTCMSVSPHS